MEQKMNMYVFKCYVKNINFYDIHKLFELKTYHTELDYRVNDINNEKYKDYIRSCMELRVE